MQTLIGAAEPEEPARPVPVFAVTISGRHTSAPPSSGYFATTFTPPSTTSVNWVTWSTTP